MKVPRIRATAVVVAVAVLAALASFAQPCRLGSALCLEAMEFPLP